MTDERCILCGDVLVKLQSLGIPEFEPAFGCVDCKKIWVIQKSGVAIHGD